MHMHTILICICIFFDFVKKINQKTLTGRGVSRVNFTKFHAYSSCTKTLEGVPKIFSKFGTLVRVGDVQGVPRRHAVRGSSVRVPYMVPSTSISNF